ncbi:MAG: Mu-like prophage major head subunit gpT family protein, partial [Aeromonas veronii]
MIVNREAIQAWFVGLKTTFNNAFGAAQTTWQKIAMESPSTSSEENYSWLSTFPKMRR